MTSQHCAHLKALRSTSLIVGGIAVAISSVVATESWWLTVVFGIVVTGALWEIWRTSSRVSQVGAWLLPVGVATSLLAVVAVSASLGLLPQWLCWVGALSFAVAYIEYLAAYTRGSSARPVASASE